MFVFRWITLFCLEKRLSEHKNPTFSKNLEGEKTPLDPPDYAYGLITVKVSVRVSILPGLSIYRARVQSISCNPSFRSSLSCTLRIPCVHGSAAAFCSLQRKKSSANACCRINKHASTKWSSIVEYGLWNTRETKLRKATSSDGFTYRPWLRAPRLWGIAQLFPMTTQN